MTDAQILQFPEPWDPNGPGQRAPQEWDNDAQRVAYWQRWKEWRKARDKIHAKQRAEERAKLAHPNWGNRRSGCCIPIPLPPTSIHHSVWERQTRACNARVVAWDGTDTRAMGYLYGACSAHLRQAIGDDPTRRWLWADGRAVEAETFEDELTLIVLGNIRG